MGAKDTVIKLNRGGILSDIEVDYYNNGAEAQAEISFKAGYEQGWNDNKPYLPDANEPWDREQTVFDDGKKAGIREVVEWIESQRVNKGINDRRQEWQAKLKEWGIEK